MSREADGHGLVSQKVNLGVTTTSWGFTAFPGQVGVILKLIAGGTLEIVNGVTTAPTGLGYPFSSGEALAMDMSGPFFLCVSGATCTVGIVRLRSQGFVDTVTQTGT